MQSISNRLHNQLHPVTKHLALKNMPSSKHTTCLAHYHKNSIERSYATAD